MESKNITNQQKLDFLEQLLEKNEQIRSQYEQFFEGSELDENDIRDDLDSLVKEIYDRLESIDTNEWVENFDYCYGGSYYDYDESMHESILEDIFSSYEDMIYSSIDKADLYRAVFYVVAIYKARLLEPDVKDDDYYVFGECFSEHVDDYLQDTIIKTLVKRVENTLISKVEIHKVINFLIEQASKEDIFSLNIFTPILQNIVLDKSEAELCKKSIELFSPLIQLHIFEILGDDNSYIKRAKEFYLEDKKVAILLLEKLQKLNDYTQYEKIAKKLFEKWSRQFAPIILKVITFSKTPKLYKRAIQQRCFDNEDMKEYKELIYYLDVSEMVTFRKRVKESYKQYFYIQILEFEKKYSDILAIAKSDKYTIHITKLINPIKNIYPDEVLQIVQNYCDKALTSQGRDRSTYVDMVQCLQAIYNINEINEQLKNYINKKLYNHTPRLPALRDELVKTGLV